MEPEVEIIKYGKYTFKVSNKIHTRYGSTDINMIFYQIGGKENCISLFVYYDNGVASNAKLPMVEYSNECAEGEIKLDRRGGTQNMLSALLLYIHKKHPTLKEVIFDDMSKIDCATESEREISSSRNINPRSPVKPIDLCRFSIAFNGCTWYEKYFDAKIADHDAHKRYRTAVDQLLTMPKPTTIDEFRAPNELHEKLNKLLQNSGPTMSDFFQSIPYKDRCDHARQWLIEFVKSKLGKNFIHTDWSITLPLNAHATFGGGRKKSARYYCPKGFKRIYHTRRQCIESVENI